MRSPCGFRTAENRAHKERSGELKAMNHRQAQKRTACVKARSRVPFGKPHARGSHRLACAKARRCISFEPLLLTVFLALFVALALAAATNTQAIAAERIDAERAGSLTLKCAYDGKALDGLAFSIWRVASANDQGAYRAIGDFSESRIDFSTLRAASDWDAAAKTLLSQAEAGKISPLEQASTASDGTATISSLEPGLYLVSDAHIEKGNGRYSSAPCLIAVPILDAAQTSWLYDVCAEPKIEKTALPAPGGESAANSSEQTGSLSKTGDAAGICAIAACGIALLCAAVAVKSRRKIKQGRRQAR